MILLPKGNPVKENIDPGKVNLPDALAKLQKGNFTGYLRFDTTKGVGILIFDKGRLISALFEGGTQREIAYDAIAVIFERSLAGGAALNIYRLSSELAMSVHALLHGEVLYKGQEVKLLDIRALLGKLKEDRITGCLRIYTTDRVALIFYREGQPLGFFHDGSTELEKTAENSMSVAKLPGAKIDVLTSRVSEEATMADLLASADLTAIWHRAQDAVARERRAREEEAARTLEEREKERRLKIAGLLRGVAEKHLGKIGAQLADKEFDKALANQGIVSESVMEDFYRRIGRAAKLVAGPSTVKQMLDDMQRGIRALLKTA
ncbi:hypothetical protein EDC39_10120 [Geothermobacter ehrlichii]|uniref:GTPase-activating protein n=1 Tax=Geothermobacter ehrlichii TaxID=213224 RepID=A0A5D3WLZ7_9BACT|nr:GTPase-activating protein [Geothermobacter ehrlichii]TYO99860.1 hypothetical protein EDC39_10120 [Geothermobacter ehrlichii]